MKYLLVFHYGDDSPGAVGDRHEAIGPFDTEDEAEAFVSDHDDTIGSGYDVATFYEPGAWLLKEA